ncbi:type IX secretion system membrane protein PorP/SprF [Pedobacter sp. PAMC26386]|nr:type IX secretion system membrane protein PorP/SprF [Pedobacter sp. PAMC26386]
MKGLKKYSLMSLLLLGMSSGYAQQTIQFSQYVFNGLAVNPAYAGYKEAWTANLSFRSQWVGIQGAPRTGTASFDGVADPDRKRVGLGFIATNDRLGPQNTSAFYGNYAYRLQLDAEDTKRLSFGIGAGFTQYSLDGSKFISTDPGDGAIPIGNESKLSPDVRFGVYYYTPKFYLGASVMDLLSGLRSNDIYSETDARVIRQVRHLYLTGGVLIPLSQSLDLKPTFMIKEDFKGPTNLDLNAYLLIQKTVWIGASYRTGVKIWNKNNLQQGLDPSDAIAAIVELNLTDRFRVGYAFDSTTSRLAGYQQGTHEISVSMTFPGKKGKVLSPRYF